MPVGLLITILLFGTLVLLLLLPVSRIRPLATVSFWGGQLVNEQPHWFLLLIGVSIVPAIVRGDLDSVAGWILVGAYGLVAVGLLALLRRAFPSREVLREAIAGLDPDTVNRLAGGRSYFTTLAAPLGFGRHRVKRTGNIEYGPAGKANRLDVYRPRTGQVTGPTLIYLHGGRFRIGDKRREAQAMHFRLASRGWLVISANYRLNPEATFPDYIVDLKRVIAWARSEGIEFGVDPERIFLAGGSSGAYIAAMAAMTANRADLQEEFEEVDTSAAGVIGLYGYFGALDLSRHIPKPLVSSHPRDHARPGLPPFLLVHGSHDSVISSQTARSLAERLERTGNQVAFAELPGAEHSFDLLRSVRVDNVIDAVEDFVNWAGVTPERGNQSPERAEELVFQR